MGILNSDVFSFLEKKFINNTCMYQVNDLRQLPIVIPTPEQETELAKLARQCMEIKRAAFAKGSLSQELVASVRHWGRRLTNEAPSYLQTAAQLTFATDPKDCLTVPRTRRQLVRRKTLRRQRRRPIRRILSETSLSKSSIDKG